MKIYMKKSQGHLETPMNKLLYSNTTDEDVLLCEKLTFKNYSLDLVKSTKFLKVICYCTRSNRTLDFLTFSL